MEEKNYPKMRESNQELPFAFMGKGKALFMKAKMKETPFPILCDEQLRRMIG
ncbi:MAG: hypothetical protein ACE5OZ_13505 [Candidatus Heimdallarchaeota archaeon]